MGDQPNCRLKYSDRGPKNENATISDTANPINDSNTATNPRRVAAYADHTTMPATTRSGQPKLFIYHLEIGHHLHGARLLERPRKLDVRRVARILAQPLHVVKLHHEAMPEALVAPAHHRPVPHTPQRRHQLRQPRQLPLVVSPLLRPHFVPIIPQHDML